MSTPGSGWQWPRCDTRTGAAHRRRHAPCQDASGLWRFADADGQPVQVLVVSDGHGGSRYDRSDVGSRFACEVALQQLHEQLSRARTSHPGSDEEWRQWLAETLPCRLVEQWRLKVLAHAEAHPRADGAAPSTLPYGATLGLLLLTPRWWGHTGLGDWDLVRIDADGQGELLSEEPDTAGGGEATFSLCMDGAERCFAARSALVEIPPQQAPFNLLLSTDGIRKSCGSDADFLTLAHYLSGLSLPAPGQPETELSQALDHISSQGSGDDVSVAIGGWGPLGDSQPRGSRRRRGGPLIVQPQLEPAPGPGVPGAVNPSAAADAEPTSTDRRLLPAGAALPLSRQQRLAAAAGLGAVPAARLAPLVALLLGLLVLAGTGLGAVAWLRLGSVGGQDGRDQPSAAETLAVVQAEAIRLCTPPRPAADPQEPGTGEQPGGLLPGQGDPQADGPLPAVDQPEMADPAGEDGGGSGQSGRPWGTGEGQGAGPGSSPDGPGSPWQGGRPPSVPAPGSGFRPGRGTGVDQELLGDITASLRQRKRNFSTLLQRSRQPEQDLAAPSQDPLSTLIAWSYRQPGLGPAAAPAKTEAPRSRPGWLPDWLPPIRPEPLQAAPPLCPELRLALQRQWQQARSAADTAQPSRPGAQGQAPAAPVQRQPGAKGPSPARLGAGAAAPSRPSLEQSER